MSKERKAMILKWICYGVVLAALYIVETSYGILPGIRGARVRLLPFFVAAAAMWEDPLHAAVFGCFAGILADAASAFPDGMYLAGYTVFAGFCTLMAKRYLRRVLPVCMLLGGGMIVVSRLTGLLFCVALGGAPYVESLRLAGSELLLSLPFSWIPYMIAKKIAMSTLREPAA